MTRRQPIVLIIDDDDIARLLAREALEQSGWSVEEAPNGRLGIEMFVQYYPDIVLLDILMPEMDGFTVCTELRRLREGLHTPILMMTGLEDYHSITQAYDVGATDFIVKPINSILLGHRVRYMLRAGHALQELRESQRQLVRARDAALEGARLKSEFLATISHEIRTPMNGIIGMDELLLDTELSLEQRDCAETIKESAHALLGIVNDMLDFSKLETGRTTVNREEFVLSQVVDATVAMFRERAQEKGLVLCQDITSSVPQTLWGDPTHLGKLLAILLSNAVKFTERGEVRIQVQPSPQPSDEPMSGQRMSADRFRFTVTDTGIGIRESDALRLFQPFVQVDGSNQRKYGGAGLGLALAKQLVELMGGTMEFESMPGKGSRFWFDLSLARASDRIPEAVGPRTALVYVKEVVSQTVISRTLEKLGYQVRLIMNVEDLAMIGPELAPSVFVLEYALLALAPTHMHVQKFKERFPRVRILELGQETFCHEMPSDLPFYIDGHLTRPLTVDAIRSAVEPSIAHLSSDE